jgi:hypothetical protein
MVCTMNTARRPSWLRVAGVSIAIFVTVLALLWFRVSAGADPVLSAQTLSGQATRGPRRRAPARRRDDRGPRRPAARAAGPRGMTSATDPFDHLFWLASRSAGVLAWR